MENSKFPSIGDSCAIVSAGYASSPPLKTTALLFDKIWVPQNPLKGFAGRSMHQEFWDSFKMDPPPSELSFYSQKELQEYKNMLIPYCDNGHMLDSGLPLNFRYLADAYNKAGYNVMVVFPTDRAFISGFSSPHSMTYQAALEQLPLVEDHNLSWDQVLRFRSDKESLSKYRNLRLWLNSGLQAKSYEEAYDKVAQKLEDYEWAIKKHGLKTCTGALSEIFGYRTAIASTATAMVTNSIVDTPLLSLLAGGAVVISRVSIWLTERIIERRSIEKESSAKDAAIIYDAKKVLSKAKPNKVIKLDQEGRMV